MASNNTGYIMLWCQTQPAKSSCLGDYLTFWASLELGRQNAQSHCPVPQGPPDTKESTFLAMQLYIYFYRLKFWAM